MFSEKERNIAIFPYFLRKFQCFWPKWAQKYPQNGSQQRGQWSEKSLLGLATVTVIPNTPVHNLMIKY